MNKITNYTMSRGSPLEILERRTLLAGEDKMEATIACNEGSLMEQVLHYTTYEGRGINALSFASAVANLKWGQETESFVSTNGFKIPYRLLDAAINVAHYVVDASDQAKAEEALQEPSLTGIAKFNVEESYAAVFFEKLKDIFWITADVVQAPGFLGFSGVLGDVIEGGIVAYCFGDGFVSRSQNLMSHFFLQHLATQSSEVLQSYDGELAHFAQQVADSQSPLKQLMLETQALFKLFAAGYGLAIPGKEVFNAKDFSIQQSVIGLFKSMLWGTGVYLAQSFGYDYLVANGYIENTIVPKEMLGGIVDRLHAENEGIETSADFGDTSALVSALLNSFTGDYVMGFTKAELSMIANEGPTDAAIELLAKRLHLTVG